MPLDPYTELRKQPVRKYITPSDFDQLKQFLTFDKQVSDLIEEVYVCLSMDMCLLESFDILHIYRIAKYIHNLTIGT